MAEGVEGAPGTSLPAGTTAPSAVDVTDEEMEQVIEARGGRIMRRDDGRPLLIGRDVPSQEEIAEAQSSWR